MGHADFPPRAVAPLLGAQGLANSVALLPDLGYLASGSDDPNRSIRMWDLRKPDIALVKLQGEQGTHSSAVFSRDGWLLASPGNMTGSVQVWDLRNPASPSVRIPLQQGAVAVLSLAFSHDGARLASGSQDGSVRVWSTRNLIAPVIFPSQGAGPLRSLAFSPNGERLFSGSFDGSVHVWDTRKPEVKPIKLPPAAPGAVNAVVFSPDGRRLAAAISTEIRVWDWRNPNPSFEKLQAARGAETVFALAFSPDGRRLAVTTSTEVQVWDLWDSTAPPLRFPEDEVCSVAFSPNGMIPAFAGANGGTLRLWELRNPDATPVALRGSQTTVDALVYLPDGVSLKSFSSRGPDLRLWQLSSSLADNLCARVWRNLPMSEGFGKELHGDAATQIGIRCLIHVAQDRGHSRLGRTSITVLPRNSASGSLISMPLTAPEGMRWISAPPPPPSALRSSPLMESGLSFKFKL